VVGLEVEEKRRRALDILAHIRGQLVLVEGLRDKEALERLGFTHVIALSGRTRRIREIFSGFGTDRPVYVLTDLDRRGEQLARIAKEELEGISIRADIDTRRELGLALNVKCFEDSERAYKELMETQVD